MLTRSPSVYILYHDRRLSQCQQVSQERSGLGRALDHGSHPISWQRNPSKAPDLHLFQRNSSPTATLDGLGRWMSAARRRRVAPSQHIMWPPSRTEERHVSSLHEPAPRSSPSPPCKNSIIVSLDLAATLTWERAELVWRRWTPSNKEPSPQNRGTWLNFLIALLIAPTAYSSITARMGKVTN